MCAYLFVSVSIVFFDGHEWGKLYASHKIVFNGFHPSLKGWQSHWLHAMSRAGFIASFDGATGVQTHAHIDTAQRCLKALGLRKGKQATHLWIDTLHSTMFAVQNKIIPGAILI